MALGLIVIAGHVLDSTLSLALHYN